MSARVDRRGMCLAQGERGRRHRRVLTVESRVERRLQWVGRCIVKARQAIHTEPRHKCGEGDMGNVCFWRVDPVVVVAGGGLLVYTGPKRPRGWRRCPQPFASQIEKLHLSFHLPPTPSPPSPLLSSPLLFLHTYTHTATFQAPVSREALQERSAQGRRRAAHHRLLSTPPHPASLFHLPTPPVTLTQHSHHHTTNPRHELPSSQQ